MINPKVVIHLEGIFALAGTNGIMTIVPFFLNKHV